MQSFLDCCCVIFPIKERRTHTGIDPVFHSSCLASASHVFSPVGSQSWRITTYMSALLSGTLGCRAAGWNVTCPRSSLQRELCRAQFASVYHNMHNMCVCVTWLYRSIFLCRPFHRRLPAPDPEILWPRPQTAASVSVQTQNMHLTLWYL